jgi:hypothetical protein
MTMSIRVVRLSSVLGGIVATIPGATPGIVTLLGGQAMLSLDRHVAEASQVLYLIGYDRSENHGEVSESLAWRPMYLTTTSLRLST